MSELNDIKQTAGKILSVDFGDTRTGLAVSDATRFLASGIGTISVGGIVKTADRTAPHQAPCGRLFFEISPITG